MSAAEVSDACLRKRRRVTMKETKYQELKKEIDLILTMVRGQEESLAGLEERMDTWDHRLAKWASRQSLEELPRPVKPKGVDRKKQELGSDGSM